MKTEYQNTIIRKIKKYRYAKQMTQVDVSIILNISTGQVGNIETPKAPHKYTLKQIYTLCNHFNISITDIFLTENEEQLSEPEKIEQLISNIIEYEQ